MSGPEIVTGDDISLSVTLKKNGATFLINAGADVKASLITPDRETILIPAVTQLNTIPGADWGNSLVVVVFTSAQTVFDYVGEAVLEIQVDDNGKTTFFASVSTIEGTI